MKTNGSSPPHELSEKVVEELHRKQKGYLYISHYLREKGLPAVDKDLEFEYKKGMDLLLRKFHNQENSPAVARDLIAKKIRFLSNRGYDQETIRKVVYEKL